LLDLGLQYFTTIFKQYKVKICKYQCMTNKTGITWNDRIRCCEVSGRGRMRMLAFVLRARIWEREGVEIASMTPSPR
jgi:hypothetical protein